MSDEGERTCPLCAEEMDLTDQQLKPCKCGYEICVWCWHHIIDMAEKDDTEGRCPACRTPYDKEKIVGMAANCERLVAEINTERKMKNQKAKSKSSEGRKQLSSVRVIQRNLVYIVGLPLNLADEDILQRREYFGQYGKVLKVSMSRTAAGVIQQFPNNTCSVYITYSKEEEAIRCIQNVHGFVLEGRPLRACFGTTKYCHAWLRNMPCSNPDCLYLHEIGSQEDSFTKDEIISAYTRVQQITGAANNMQRRSGNMLPPPADDYMNNSSGKPIVKNASSNSATILRGSPPNGSSGRSIALHPVAAAAWGTRTTNCPPPAGGLLCPNGPAKAKADTVSGTLAFSSAVAGSSQNSSLHSDVTKRPPSSDESHTNPRVQNESLKPEKQFNSTDNLSDAGENTATSDGPLTPGNLNSQLSSLPLSRDDDRGSCTITNTSSSTDFSGQSCSSGPEEATIATNEEIQNLCSDLSSSINIDRNGQNEYYGMARPNSPPSDHILIKSPQRQSLQQHNAEKFRDVQITCASVIATPSDYEECIPREHSDWRLDSQTQVPLATAEVEDDIASFDNQRLKDPEVFCHSPYLPKSTSFLHVPNHSSHCLMQHGEQSPAVNVDFASADSKVGDESLLNASSLLCNGYPGKWVSSRTSSTTECLLPQEERSEHCIGRLFSEAVNAGSDAALDKGENSIISNILSMDFDAWDDSLTSPQNLAKLLGDNTSNQSVPLKKPSIKVQNNSQSRFSFARQDEPKIQTFHQHPSYGISEQLPNRGSFIQEFAERDFYIDKKLGITNGFPSNKLEESESLGSGHFVASNKLSGVSRAQISAPPGFSVPSRPPPPGFSSYERVEQAFNSMSGNSLLDPSSLLRNSYQTPSAGNIGSTGDIELVDPAILAVGTGRLQGQGHVNSPGLDIRSSFAPQLNYFENDARLQLLMQRSLSQPQNRFSEIGSAFSHISDSYGISSRLDQSQVSNLAPYAQLSLQQQSRNAILSNGQWDGWSEVQSGSSLGVAELLRNERLGFNKLYTGYDDSKYRMPNSGDLYNRTYGM